MKKFLLMAAALAAISSAAMAGQYDIAFPVRTGTGTLEGNSYTTTLTVTGTAQVFSTGSGATLSGTYPLQAGSNTAVLTNGTTTFTNGLGSTALSGSTFTLFAAYNIVTVSGSGTITTSTSSVYNAQINLPNLGANGTWETVNASDTNGVVQTTGSGLVVNAGLVLEGTAAIVAEDGTNPVPQGTVGLSASNTPVMYTGTGWSGGNVSW
jgi:hypothetical protein